MEEKTTLIAKRPVGIWNKEIKFSFKNLFKSISTGAVAYFTSNTPELIKSSISLIDTVKFKNKPEILVYSLVIKSFQQSIIELIDENIDKLYPDFKTINNFQEYKEYEVLIKEIEKTIDNQDLIIGIDFFDNPTKITILQPLIDIVQKWLMVFGFSSIEAKNTSKKIETYFIYFLNDNWRKNSEDYKTILEKIITPFSKITKIELEWRSYNSYLLKQIEEPVFDEHFGLKDIFIKLFGYYEKRVTKKDETIIEKHVVNVFDFLDNWIYKIKNEEDAIKVISGGPGSGKSTLAKMYSSFISTKNNVKVIYIPLQHLNVKDDLTLSVGDYLQESNFFINNPLNEIHKYSSKLLIIFDGLDELSKQGKHAYELAKEFIDEIQRKTSVINRSKIKLLVLLTGRELTIQNQSASFRKPYQVLNLLPYYNSNTSIYIDKNNFLDTDLRDMWWRNYSKLKDLKYKGFPNELKNPNLDEITAQPLLNYLVALTYERNIIKFDDKTNLNDIYRDLIKAVFDRQYEKKQHKVITELSLNENNFFRILEEIAISAWHSGDIKTTTIKKINQHIDNNNLVSLFQEFQLGVQAGISRLLTAFYFRQKGIDADQNKTFEFTHKSFGEYLTSRRIVNLLLLLTKKISMHYKNPDEGIDKKEALKKIIEILSVMPIDNYLFSFLSNEVKLHPKTQINTLQNTIILLIEFALKNGMPIELLSPRPEFEKELCYYRNSILCLFVFLKITSDYTKKKSKINWFNNTSLFELITVLSPLKPRRVDTFLTKKHKEPFERELPALINTCFTNMIIKDCLLASLDLTYADFSDSVLNNITLSGSDLFGTKFENTKMEGVNFYRANLKQCIFNKTTFVQNYNYYITIDQIKQTKFFNNVIGLDNELMAELERERKMEIERKIKMERERKRKIKRERGKLREKANKTIIKK